MVWELQDVDSGDESDDSVPDLVSGTTSSEESSSEGEPTHQVQLRRPTVRVRLALAAAGWQCVLRRAAL